MSSRTFKYLATVIGCGMVAMMNSTELQAGNKSELATFVDSVQAAHGLRAWWGKEAMVADVEIVFGGNTVLDGTFTFEAHGPRARFDRKDGATVIFDGTTAWVSPATAKTQRGRFHVLTWPWFIMAPFKMQGVGIHLSDLQYNEVNGKEYASVLQTFGEDVGDTPDDWYRFYVDPKTKRIEAMSYIVTYGKDLEEANRKPSIIKYYDYVDADGPLVSTRYEFWYWDPEKRAVVGEAPKGTGTVSNIQYIAQQEADFSVPAGARELLLK